MTNQDKTHYRKAFDSPYLSSADIVDMTVLTIKCVKFESDRTKKTKDSFNTAHFAERELRPGEKLKPMILNATNSKVLAKLTGTPFIEDWVNVPVAIYVDKAVKFGRDTVEGLRISPKAPGRKQLTPEMATAWANAKAAYLRDGNLESVMSRVAISDEHIAQLKAECASQEEEVAE